MNELSSKTFNPGEGLERIEVRGKDIASLYPQPEGEMPEKLDWNSLSDAVNGEAKESVRAEVREHVDPALQEGLDTLKDVSATLTEMGELLRSLKESAGPSELTREQLDSVAAKGETIRQGINHFIDKTYDYAPEVVRNIFDGIRFFDKYTDFSNYENCVKTFQEYGGALGAVAGAAAGAKIGYSTGAILGLNFAWIPSASYILPVVGTAAGEQIGKQGGEKLGQFLGESLGERMCK